MEYITALMEYVAYWYLTQTPHQFAACLTQALIVQFPMDICFYYKKHVGNSSNHLKGNL